MGAIFSAGLLVAGVVAALWWILREPPLAANEVRVRYLHGETCILTDWSFRVRRFVSRSWARGPVLRTGPPDIQAVDDTSLRIFSPMGEKLVIHRGDLRLLRFNIVEDDDPYGRRVSSVTIETRTGRTRIPALALPRFSRSRVLVPVASHYFPQHSDDYMSWGNVRMTLVGTPSPGCSARREIPLTRPHHSARRTPLKIEFAGI